MKLRYLFATLVAALTVFAGCEKEADHYLEEIQVSSSYLAFPAEGGPVDLTITSIADWTVKDLPEWISSSAMAGAAGQNTIRLTATAATETREDSFSIECAGKAQTVNVMQVTEKQEPKLTPMNEVIAAGAGNFRISGTVTKITSTSYGNWYLNDGTTDANNGLGMYVYGTLNKKGNTYDKNNAAMENLNCPANPDAWEFAVGDILTVEGPYQFYNNTTPEMVDVTVISIERSLIGVEGVELLGVEEGAGINTFPQEGGSIKVTLKNKGDNFKVVIPDEAKDWLFIEDFGPDYVIFRTQENAGGDRSVTVSFTTVSDGITYSCSQDFVQKGAIVEISIADFLAKESGDSHQYRITGVIISNYESDKKGQSFTFRDWSGQTLVYRLDDYQASGAKVGDIITVVGKRGDYNGDPQMVNAVYEKHFSVKQISIEDFLKEPDVKDSKNPDVFYMVTGTISSLLDSNGKENDYGNMYISDGTTELYLYGLYPGWGALGDARKGFVKAAGIKVGDTLTSIGYKSTWNGLVELCGGIYFSHEAGSGPGPEASITIDGNPADWTLQGIASDETPADAVLGGIKSAKAYYGDKLYLLAEFSDEALAKGVADGKLRFHVYFSGAEGLLDHHWADKNIEYMMEGKATSGGNYVNFTSALHKNKGGVWSWEDTGVTLATESAGNGNFYEIAIDYSNYPGGFPEQIEVGIDCADGNYIALGYAPQKSRKFALKKGEVVVLPDLPGEDPALFLNEFDTKSKQLEIYNSTDAEVDIAGWQLVKDGGLEDKDIYTIPASLEASKVPAKGYAVFTCKQSDVANGPLFGLSGTKGFKIELKHGDNVVDVADNLTSITEIPEGSSWGRETDGADNFVLFDTPTIGGPNGAAAPPVDEGQSVSEILGLEKGAEVKSAESLVTAITARGFVMTDGTKAVYVYTQNNADVNGVAKVGDKVKVTGSKTTYNGVHEVEKVSALEVVSSGNSVSYPDPKDITASLADYTNTEAEYITFVGTLKISGNFYNVEVDGADASKKQGSLVYPVDADATKALDGKHLRFTGYFNGLSGSDKYVNIITTSIEEVANGSGDTEVSITIDGNYDDWADVPGATPASVFNAFKVTNDADNFYFYVETDPGSRLWEGGGYLYLYFDWDNDLSTGAYSGATGMQGHNYEAYTFMFIFEDNKISAPTESSEAHGMTLDGLKIAGSDSSDAIVKFEISIPRANFEQKVNAGDVIGINSYRSKDGGNVYFPGYVVK